MIIMELVYEEWSYIPLFEGIYIISNRGRIVSMTRLISVTGRGKRPQKGQEIKPYKMPKGYMQVCLHRLGDDVDTYINILVAASYIENPENKPWVNHKDGVRWNNNYSNLEWSTISKNHLHAYKYLNRVNPTACPLIMVDANGNELKRFANCCEAAKAVGKNPSTIADYVNGVIKLSRQGYTFKKAI